MGEPSKTNEPTKDGLNPFNPLNPLGINLQNPDDSTDDDKSDDSDDEELPAHKQTIGVNGITEKPIPKPNENPNGDAPTAKESRKTGRYKKTGGRSHRQREINFWAILDPHEDDSNTNKPFKKGMKRHQ